MVVSWDFMGIYLTIVECCYSDAINQPFLMVGIPPINMVMNGGWLLLLYQHYIPFKYYISRLHLSLYIYVICIYYYTSNYANIARTRNLQSSSLRIEIFVLFFATGDGNLPHSMAKRPRDVASLATTKLLLGILRLK